MDALFTPAERAFKAAVSLPFRRGEAGLPFGDGSIEAPPARLAELLSGLGLGPRSPLEAVVALDEISRARVAEGIALAEREAGPLHDLGLAAAFLGASSALLEACCASAGASGVFDGAILGPRDVQTAWEEARVEIESLRLLAGRQALRSGAAPDPEGWARLLRQAAVLGDTVATLAERAVPSAPDAFRAAIASLRDAAGRILSSRSSP